MGLCNITIQMFGIIVFFKKLILLLSKDKLIRNGGENIYVTKIIIFQINAVLQTLYLSKSTISQFPHFIKKQKLLLRTVSWWPNQHINITS